MMAYKTDWKAQAQAATDQAAAIRKTFPSAADVKEMTLDPATREMLEVLDDLGCDNCFSRFDAQKPHCSHGLAGTCCRNCNMGPCRITTKACRGTCGADADVIVSRNLLRWVAAGVASHGARSREVMLTLKAAASGQLQLPIRGVVKLRAVAEALGFDKARPISDLANDVADVLLEDLGRVVPGDHRTLAALAPKDRVDLWRNEGILPIGAQHEVFEALHRSGTGTDGDAHSILRHVLRCGLAFAWSSVVGGAIAMDILYGSPVRSTVEVNLGTLQEGWVNLALHGHSPVLVQAIVVAARRPELIEEAQRTGAKGIRLYGICCSGLSAMYRWGNVYPLANAVGAELALATGALDLWVADMQDVYPAIMAVAECVQTTVITTSDSCRLPGASHIALPKQLGGHGHRHAFDQSHSHDAGCQGELAHNHGHSHDAPILSWDVGEQLAQIGERVVREAIRCHSARKHVPRRIPSAKVTAEVGFSAESAVSAFGGATDMAESLRNGSIRGIVNLVGCNNPKVPYERAILDVVDTLLANDILVLTNGCASFALLKTGYCSPEASSKCGDRLRATLERAGSLPPVLHLGECLDNARASGLFRLLADELRSPLASLPFAFSSPEWSNEKGVGAALSFRLLGLNSYHCVAPPTFGSELVEHFLGHDTQQILGAVMVVQPDPRVLGLRIVSDFHERRRNLGWT